MVFTRALSVSNRHVDTIDSKFEAWLGFDKRLGLEHIPTPRLYLYLNTVTQNKSTVLWNFIEYFSLPLRLLGKTTTRRMLNYDHKWNNHNKSESHLQNYDVLVFVLTLGISCLLWWMWSDAQICLMAKTTSSLPTCLRGEFSKKNNVDCNWKITKKTVTGFRPFGDIYGVTWKSNKEVDLLLSRDAHSNWFGFIEMPVWITTCYFVHFAKYSIKHKTNTWVILKCLLKRLK